MKRIIVTLADGFEEIEGLTVVDLCRRAGIEVVMVSISDTCTVTGAHGICLQADTLFDEVNLADVDMMVLPGGMPGTKYLRGHEGVCAGLKEMVAAGKQVAAICAAPSVLGDLGLLAGCDACCYPSFESQLLGANVKYEEVCESAQTITSRGLGTAIPFALKIIERLLDAEVAQKISDSVIYQLS